MFGEILKSINFFAPTVTGLKEKLIVSIENFKYVSCQ